MVFPNNGNSFLQRVWNYWEEIKLETIKVVEALGQEHKEFAHLKGEVLQMVFDEMGKRKRGKVEIIFGEPSLYKVLFADEMLVFSSRNSRSISYLECHGIAMKILFSESDEVKVKVNNETPLEITGTMHTRRI